MRIFSRKSRGTKEIEPEISEKRISPREEFERQLFIDIKFKDYTKENVVTQEIKDTAYEKLQLGKLTEYLDNKFPDKELSINVKRTNYVIKGTVSIRNPCKKKKRRCLFFYLVLFWKLP